MILKEIKNAMDTAKYLYILHYILISLLLFDVALRYKLNESSKYMTLAGALLLPLGRAAIENIRKNKK